MLNDAEMRHETEITKVGLNDYSFFTVYYICMFSKQEKVMSG